ncbi:MAG: hypothetical protein ABI992_09915 [Chthoniobacterales bacterium]
MATSIPGQNPTSEPGEPMPLEAISELIRDAARKGPASDRSLAAMTPDVHTEQILSAVKRAREKAYVAKPKPLRRLFRNQGAVNDSLIEAVYHLAAQNQELMDEVNELRAAMTRLQREKNRSARSEPAPTEKGPAQEAACE